MMLIADLLPALESLSHEDKLCLMQVLLKQIAHEEGVALCALETSSVSPTIQDAHTVAAALTAALTTPAALACPPPHPPCEQEQTQPQVDVAPHSG